jgi:uncharacterized membrane protein YtjA (UPF0391 family)
MEHTGTRYAQIAGVGRRNERTSFQEAPTMLRLALLFFIIALVAGLFGFNFIEGMTFFAAKIFFFLFLVLAVIFVLGGLLGGSAPRDVV